MSDWTSFQKAHYHESQTKAVMDHLRSKGMPEEVIEREKRRLQECDVYLNNRYQVAIDESQNEDGSQVLVHLSIKRRDKEQLGDSHWRDLQRIKNELIGPEYEAVEIYPSEERKVDTSNQYHLWIIMNADGSPVTYPFGFNQRAVISHDEGGTAKQTDPDDEDTASLGQYIQDNYHEGPNP